MELLFVFLIGAIGGGLARYITPRRDRYGVVLLPALSAAVASAAWVVMTWVGLKWNAGLIWWISIVLSLVLSVVVALWTGRSRQQHDESRFAQLSGGAVL